MKSQILGLRTSCIIFGLMAIAQLGRLIIQPDIKAAGYTIPLWLSGVAFVFFSGMSLWMWRLSKR